jgi:hypothetical protein
MLDILPPSISEQFAFIQLNSIKSYIFLQNAVIHQGQEHMQMAAYHWVQLHTPGNHTFMDPLSFTLFQNWLGDSPFLSDEVGDQEPQPTQP